MFHAHRSTLRRSLAGTALATAALLGAAAPAQAQEAEQFIPLLAYRTGPYSPNGTPWANGKQDYLKLINARDGGVNGVKLTWEECETGYATDRGVECYERLKGKGPTGATYFDPQSTGITIALTDKALTDHIPLITMGYGPSEAADGTAFQWNFPLLGTYWSAMDVILKDLAAKGSLKGKKIAFVYHDSPFGKEPMPVLEARAKEMGFTVIPVPITPPGVEQKSAWLQVRQNRPDHVILWGWGVMNSTALKEAQATGFPRDRMTGVWWSGTDPDVRDVGMGAKGYRSVTLQIGSGQEKLHQEILKLVYDKGQGSGPREDVGSILYTRGLMIQVLAVEAIRTAQEKFGKGKPINGEQMRWGLEHLNIDAARWEAIGLGALKPIRTSCDDHNGSTWARMLTWDGKAWGYTSEPMQADMAFLKPMIRTASDRYVADKKLTRRTGCE